MSSSIYDVPIHALDGSPADLHAEQGKALLIVNVASQCGLTPQYAGLQELQETYSARGFDVLGFPCNQFGSQEPGTSDQIKTFCESSFGVTFPMFEKIEVNGPGRHPLYDILTETADGEGHTGDIRWNFEKFVVSPDGAVVARFSPVVKPDDPALVETIEKVLPTP
jgi:glutathione peroxidase